MYNHGTAFQVYMSGTQVEAESESLLQILAGADSTATSIRMTLLYLITNPPAYTRLRAELEAVAPGKISHPVIRNEKALKLPYLRACITEASRLWMPLSGPNAKVIPSAGLFIGWPTRILP